MFVNKKKRIDIFFVHIVCCILCSLHRPVLCRLWPSSFVQISSSFEFTRSHLIPRKKKYNSKRIVAGR